MARRNKSKTQHAARPIMNKEGQLRRPERQKAHRRKLKQQGARFGPHNDVAPDPTPKTKKPFNPFNLGARVDEAKKGDSPFG